MNEKVNPENRPTAAAVGTFDGVHVGHETVLSHLRTLAEERGLTPIALTFDRHPLALIAPDRMPPAICTPGRKADLIRKAGVAPIVLPFDEKLRATTAADWMKELSEKYATRLLVVGYDNTFGSDGINLSLADYRRIGAEHGIEVIEAPFVPGASSSAVRKAVATGDVEKAASILGRNFSLPGIVVQGNQLGRTIGFPTANLMPEPGIVVPGKGVYAALAFLPDGSHLPAVVNVGVRPTVRRGNDLTVEAHIPDWRGDLYGHPLTLSFHKRLRDEMQFNSIQTLKGQIAKDTAETKLFFAEATKQGK